MIRVYYEENPAGNYWLEYGPDDCAMVEHCLSSHGWNPTEAGAKAFIYLMTAHGWKVELGDSVVIG